MSIGRRIREIRVEKRLTQSELASKIGMAQAQLSRYEKDRKVPQMKILESIATALDVDVSKLVSEKNYDTINHSFSKKDLISEKELIVIAKRTTQNGLIKIENFLELLQNVLQAQNIMKEANNFSH